MILTIKHIWGYDKPKFNTPFDAEFNALSEKIWLMGPLKKNIWEKLGVLREKNTKNLSTPSGYKIIETY